MEMANLKERKREGFIEGWEGRRDNKTHNGKQNNHI